MEPSRLSLLIAMAALGLLLCGQAVRAEPDPVLSAARDEAVQAREQALRHAEHMQSLENDLRSLQELTRRNAVALETMREQMEEARRERDTMALLALVLALLLAVGVIAWAWRSRLRSLKRAPSRLDARTLSDAVASGAPDIDLNIIESTSGKAAAPRMVDAEEPIHLQQQADFFQSIGDRDRTVAGLLYNLARELEALPPPQLRLDIDLGRLSAPDAEDHAFGVSTPVPISR